MNQKECKLLNEYLYIVQAIPRPQATNSAPIAGWQSYTWDMQAFHKATHDFLNGLIYPDDIGNLFPPPEQVLGAIRAWMKRRAAEQWKFSRDSIEYVEGWRDDEPN